MNSKGTYEKAAIDFYEKKRMKKLAGIKENKKPLSSDFKNRIDQLAINSRKDLNEIKRRN
jgi:hypothetical protein